LTASHARMEAQQVTLQPLNSQGCAIYALINLYWQLGIEPPPMYRMEELIDKDILQGGLYLADVLMFAAKEDFPGLVSVAVVPPSLNLSDVLPYYIKVGCGVIVAFEIVIAGQVFPHAAVVESCDADFVTVLCSVNGKMDLPYVMKEIEGKVLPAAYIHGQLYPFGLDWSFWLLSPAGKSLSRIKFNL
jgi:hypothetical protein